MKQIKLFFIAVALMVSVLASAQNITVTGVIKDSSNGEGIPFASLQVKGTMIGTSSDLDGNYVIDVPSDGVLIFSSVGYVTVEVPVQDRTVVDVMLDPDTEMLEETIVVAFGTATKESFTGSATVVKSDDIAKVQASDATRALEGVVAGVQMTTSSGALDDSPSILIRGIGSLQAASEPLIVVDGISFAGKISDINPADIESMTVLKDAASNALYGSRGAGGVIMITTKKAKHGEAVVNVDAKWGLNTKALRSYDYITEPGQYYETYYAALRNYYSTEQGMSDYDAHIQANQTILGNVNDGGLGYLVYTYPDSEALIGMNGKLNPNATLGRVIDYNGQSYYLTPDDWLGAAYRNTLRQEYNISVSGTTGNAQILASFGYLNNKGITHGSDMYRYTARLRTDYQAKEWFKVGGNLSFTNSMFNNGNPADGSEGSTANVLDIANKIAPIYPIYVRDAMGRIMKDKHGFDIYDYGTGENAGLSRPYLANSNALQSAYLDKYYYDTNSFNGSAYAEVKFLKDFTFTFNAGLNYLESRVTNIQNMYYGQYATMGGLIGKSQSRGMAINLQQLLNWNRSFGLHNAAVLFGHETYATDSNQLSASKSQLFSMDSDELNGAVVDGKTSGSSRSQYNNEGYFLRAQYDFDNRIFVSGSYRLDASSKFHPDHRWGSFWSLGGGWIVNQEGWFPRTPWIDMLKLKASIGSQGNDGISNYLYTDQYALSNNLGKPAIQFGQKGNEEITWETNTNINAGVDFDFLRGKVSGSFEYFYRLTSDMLNWFSVPASLGYSGYYDNIGDMRNSGIEFSANVNLVQKRDFNWNFYFNFTHYTNKIIMLPDEKKTTVIEGHPGYASGTRFYGEGLPAMTFYMQKYAGVDPDTGESLWYRDVTDENGNVTRVTTNEYSLATQYLCDDPTPKLYGGFGTSFDFKGLDFSVAFTYSLGGLTYDSSYASYMASPVTGSTGSNFHKDVLKAWTPENRDTDVPRFQFNDQYVARTSDRFLTSASYLNIQNAQIGYTLPARITSKMHISRLRLYVACDNIWYLSCRKGLDPRQTVTGSTNGTKTSPVRTISGGINFSF